MTTAAHMATHLAPADADTWTRDRFRAWRLITANHREDPHAEAEAIGELGDCVRCLRRLLRIVALEAALAIEEQHEHRGTAIAAAMRQIAALLDTREAGGSPYGCPYDAALGDDEAAAS
jgi:ferric-dicitrate binding protein FerR (iron transport regulator)